MKLYKVTVRQQVTGDSGKKVDTFYTFCLSSDKHQQYVEQFASELLGLKSHQLDVVYIAPYIVPLRGTHSREAQKRNFYDQMLNDNNWKP